MFAYIVIFISIIFGGFIAYNRKIPIEKRNKDFYFASATLLTFFSGLRGHSVGADTDSYSEWFTFLGDFTWDDIFHRQTIDIEQGYKIYNYILSRISDNPRIVIFVSSAIIIFSLLYFLYKYSDNFFVSVILFLGLNHFLTSLNTYRNYLALAIIIWAYEALLNKKYIRALVLMIAGFYFHRISIVFSAVMVLAYLLRNKRKNVLIAFGVEVALVPLIPTAMNIFATIYPKYMLYLRYDTLESAKGKLNIIFFIMEIAIVLYYLIKKDEESPEMNMQMIILSAGSVLRIVGNTIPRGFRLVQMLNFSILLIIPHIIQKRRINRKIYVIIVCLVSFALYVYYLLTDPAQIVPYVFIE